MCMMVLKVRQEHAESTQSLVKIQVPRSLHGSVDNQKFVHISKSKLHVAWTFTKSKKDTVNIRRRIYILNN